MRVKPGLALLLVLCVSGAAAAQPAAEARLESGVLTLQSRVDFDRAILTVTGPGGLVERLTFGPGETIEFSAADTREGYFAEGGYQYQLRLVRGQEIGDVSRVDRPDAQIVSGSFVVIGGIVSESGPDAAGANVVTEKVESLAAETYFADDLQVAGDLGLGHANGQNPDKEIDIEDISELFVRFDDTGAAVTTWDIGIPADSFQWVVSHVDASPTTPFKILDNAFTDTLVLNGSGDVGIGTATPAERLHIVGSEDIRMEDGGGTIWDLGHGSGAAGDFDIQLIDDGAGNNVGSVVTLENDDNPGLWVQGVGIFQANPLARLHVGSPGNDGTAKILVAETNATVTGRTLFELQNKGNVQFFFQNTDSGDIWQMSQLSTVFQVSTPSGNGKFRVRKGGGLQALTGSTTILDLNSTGDLTVKSVTQTSSRAEKRGFESVDGISVLDKVAGLPISEWSYKADNPSVRHLGPMAEDFHAAFGLGKTDKGITSVDTSGVALAAIQGLVQENKRLEERIADLEEMVQALAEH